jgi:exodeoxyribonuclease VII large subunit
VQGQGAAESVVKGIEYFNETKMCDTLIVGRGGGSIEDLWAFNEEIVARAIFASEIPIISAVGHETDFTMCDFVADMRAPTPSAAAELAFFDANELMMRMDSMQKRAFTVLDRRIRVLEAKLEGFNKDLKMRSPEKVTADKLLRVERLGERLDMLSRSRLEASLGNFRTLCARLEANNPLSVLSRGYSVVENERGDIVSRLSDVEVDESVTVRLSDGQLCARVTQKN